MERKDAGEYPQELLDLFDRFVHGDIDRRTFLDRAGKFAVGGLSATAILDSLRPNFTWAQQVGAQDPRITTETVTVPSPQGNGSIKGHFARPRNATGRLPAVLVIHENRGLNPYIEDVARRLAVENFIAYAPDGLTSVGGYPGDEDRARALFPTVDREKMTVDFIATARWLKARPDCNGKVGAVGFCFGGGIVGTLAVRMGADLSAGVSFYGSAPDAADVPRIRAPLLVQYAGLDTRINAGRPEFEEALKANGMAYEMHMYEGANHGFHNDTTPRYDEAAAKLAWERTLAWFNRYLRS
jgi:carboxymethylenebutenolidase